MSEAKVSYCVRSEFSKESYATGMRRFEDHAEFIAWLRTNLERGPVLITHIEAETGS